jgi:hypothetical protein
VHNSDFAFIVFASILAVSCSRRAEGDAAPAPSGPSRVDAAAAAPDDAAAEVEAGAAIADAGDAIVDAAVDASADATTADAGAAADLRIGIAIGNVRIGMTRAELVAARGAPESSTKTAGHELARYAGGGLAVSLEGGRVKGIFAYSGVAGGYEKATRRFAVRGPNGITMDSTADEIVHALGPADERGELSHAPIPSRWLAYDAGVSFELVKSSGQLVSITVLAPKAKPAK